MSDLVTRLSWLDYDEFGHRLRRCSKRDREFLLACWVREHKWHRDIAATATRDHQRYRDLEVIVRDQRRHIANLEAQLLPYLTAEPVTTEAML